MSVNFQNLVKNILKFIRYVVCNITHQYDQLHLYRNLCLHSSILCIILKYNLGQISHLSTDENVYPYKNLAWSEGVTKVMLMTKINL